MTDKEYHAFANASFAIMRDNRCHTAARTASSRSIRNRPNAGDRDEPAGEPFVGARVQGDRVPDREDRGEARDRLHARRARQRHHARHARLLRADDRLRGREVAALRVREVPVGEGRARPADEERRRGDGDRPHVPRGPRQGRSIARDGRPASICRCSRRATTSPPVERVGSRSRAGPVFRSGGASSSA